MSTLSVPIFPLNTVLFPGGPLPLRIFEPRYLDMVSHCLKTDTAFGVCLIREGKEVGTAASTCRIGTLAKIVDWNRLPEGLLGITALGRERFSLESTTVEKNRLLTGTVVMLPEPEQKTLPSALETLPRLLEQIMPEAGPLYDLIPRKYDDLNWIAYRLAEILPLDTSERQELLELEDALQRLYQIHTNIADILGQGTQS